MILTNWLINEFFNISRIESLIIWLINNLYHYLMKYTIN